MTGIGFEPNLETDKAAAPDPTYSEGMRSSFVKAVLFPRIVYDDAPYQNGADACYLYPTENPLKPPLKYKHKKPTPVKHETPQKLYPSLPRHWTDNRRSMLAPLPLL